MSRVVASDRQQPPVAPLGARPRPGPLGVGVGAAAVVLALLWIGVDTGTMLAALDPVVDGWVVAVRPAPLVEAARIVSTVGQPAVTGALLAVVAVIVAWRRRSWAPVGAAAVALVLLAALDQGVKAVVARPRPPLEWHAMLAQGLSFPSGHSLWSCGALLFVVVIAGPRVRVPLGVVAVLGIVAVGGARVVLAVHYPSDVLAGWCLAVIADGLALAAAYTIHSRSARDHPAS